MTTYTTNYNIPKPDGATEKADPALAYNPALNIIDTEMARIQTEVAGLSVFPKTIVNVTTQFTFNTTTYVEYVPFTMNVVAGQTYVFFADLNFLCYDTNPDVRVYWYSTVGDISVAQFSLDTIVDGDYIPTTVQDYDAVNLQMKTTYDYFQAPVASSTSSVKFRGTFVATGTGTLKMFLAQHASSFNLTALEPGSFLEYRRVS